MTGPMGIWDDLFGKIASNRPKNQAELGYGFNIVVVLVVATAFLLYLLYYMNRDRVTVPSLDGKKPGLVIPGTNTPALPNRKQATDSAAKSDDIKPEPAKRNGAIAVTVKRSKTDTDLLAGKRLFPIPNEETLTVLDCLDGDTIIVRSKEGKERVRLAGIVAPRLGEKGHSDEPYARVAQEFIRRRIKDHYDKVTLVVDGDSADAYDRRLALVYLDSDKNFLLNEELIRLGFVKVEPNYRINKTLMSHFINLQELAKSQGRGVWEPKKEVTKSDP